MAKKKRTSKRASKRPAKKSKKPAAAKRAPSKRSIGNKSVDTLLKQFAKQRSTKEAQLETLRKKKEELEGRARKLREQINKLAEQEKKFRDELAHLDARRDSEVSQLLTNLGVQLRGAAYQSSSSEGDAHKRSGNPTGPRDRVSQSLSKSRENLN